MRAIRTARPLILLTVLAALGCSNPAKTTSGPAASNSKPAPVTIDPAQLRCLSLSMYWEAKAEGPKGMLAVGHVVMNRVDHEKFPNTPCKVVFEGGEAPPCQFSWYCDGKSDRPTESQNWATALRLAQELLSSKRKDTTKGALFFHAVGMKNPWRIPRTPTVTIGGHIFYRL